jgi:hypothetical protein
LTLKQPQFCMQSRPPTPSPSISRCQQARHGARSSSLDDEDASISSHVYTVIHPVLCREPKYLRHRPASSNALCLTIEMDKQRPQRSFSRFFRTIGSHHPEMTAAARSPTRLLYQLPCNTKLCHNRTVAMPRRRIRSSEVMLSSRSISLIGCMSAEVVESFLLDR